MMFDMIGDRLKELRLAVGLDQVQFGAIADTSKQYVSQLENSVNKKPNPEFVQRWAAHFKVRMEWITSGKLPKDALVQDDPVTASGWLPTLGYAQAAGLGNGQRAEDWADASRGVRMSPGCFAGCSVFSCMETVLYVSRVIAGDGS